jgi:rhamnose transport system permease protein
LRNSQVAAICGAVIAAAIIVAATNAWLVHSLGTSRGPDVSAAAPRVAAAPVSRPVIAMMPKAKGDPYFISCRAGAEEAAKEFDVELIWDGPTNLDAARQNELVENWITRKVDAIAVAVENRGGISSVLSKARAKGIRVLTWDADAEPDARDFFVNQATPEGIANTLTDEAARLLGGEGQLAHSARRTRTNGSQTSASVLRRSIRTSRSPQSGRATTTVTRRSPKHRRSCVPIRR